ncbi:FAD binding domain-containing protein [Bacillus infantis]|uniref:FAD binding domain-containing protein n=1 Tax=Bacillus infantis TaxID=324767 RepID=UPI003CFB5EF6
MIPFDFQYSKPQSIEEAVRQYHEYRSSGKKPSYFSGLTELITLGRLNLVYTDAVIDLKGVEGYQGMREDGQYLILGGGAALTAIAESNLFPLLAKISSEIADRTSRNKITLAGNICGQFFYREAVLPLLLSDCLFGIAGTEGLVYHPIHHVFEQEIRIKEGDFLFCILVEKEYRELPYVSIKKRKQWDTGYPLITAAALLKEGEIRMAFSGVCPFPFRSREVEKMLNDRGLTAAERAERALAYLPQPILDDVEGSKEYRLFVLRNTITDSIQQLEGERQ